MSLSNRLKLLFSRYPDKSQADLARFAGVKPPSVNDWLSGKTKKMAGPTLINVAAYFSVNPTWLATGEGPMEPPGGAVIGQNYTFIPGEASGSNKPPALTGRAGRALEIVELENNPDYPAIRRVNITAKAGVTGYAVDYIDEDRPPIFFRRDWYDSNGYKPEKMLAMRVAGESMIPSLHPGDLIVVNTAQTQPKQGIAFLVSFEGEVVVKRLVRDDGQWWLTSDNQDQRRYPRVKCNGETEIIGEVVYLQTAVI